MVRPRKYHTAREQKEARTASRRKWIQAHPEQWRAILARNYLRRKTRSLLGRVRAIQKQLA